MLKKQEITELLSQFEAITVEYNGIECWSARELQTLLGYTQWRRFTNAIDKAKEACVNAGGNIPDHFAGVGKMVTISNQ